MGLMDILNGMQHGPRGAPPPAGSGAGGKKGLSPMMIALIGLLAYKALKGRGSHAGPAGTPAPLPPGGTATGGRPGGSLDDILGGLLGGRPGAPGASPAGGGLGGILGGLFGGRSSAPADANPAGGRPGGGGLADMLPGGLGGLLGGAAAGSVLSGGLDTILKELQQSGHGRTAESWVAKGPNDDIAPGDLAHALGSDTIDSLSRQTGLDRDELLEGLRRYLPQVVDQLTPDGRVPTPEEAGRMV